MEYDLIICFETHVELKTQTKLFCDCKVSYDSPPNSRICPVCTGQPGALPVLNRRAIEYAIKAGLAFDCDIIRLSGFARKNYFYPDLPKGYQISQFENPFCEMGHLEIQTDDGRPYEVGIKRIHLEEDAGKLVHVEAGKEGNGYSLVDYNRSGVPLLEIVADHTRNPVRSVSEAMSYLEKLRQILRYTGISDCRLEMGQFRCDVNVSLRRSGSNAFGDRVEIKNMASFRSIAEAIEYERDRQAEILDSGGTISQETRLFDEEKMITIPMRSKEDAPDYRYFPDPDLVEVEIDQQFLEKIEQSMPELPEQKVRRFIESYSLSRHDALILTRDRETSEYFEQSANACNQGKRAGSWIINDLFKLLNENSLSMARCPVSSQDFARLMILLKDGVITENIGSTVLAEMFKRGCGPDAIIEEMDLRTIDDLPTLERMLKEAMEENPDAVEKIKKGDDRPMNFLVGMVMKKSGGKANARKLRQVARELMGRT